MKLKFFLASSSLCLTVLTHGADVNGANPAQGAYPENPRAGKILACHSEAELKADFVKQLQRHEIYGNPDLIEHEGVSATARFYQQQVAEKYRLGKGPLLEKNLFTHLSTDKVFDGAQVFQEGFPEIAVPRAGDVVLNLDFLRPDNPGTFYSKRGMIHARVVVGVIERDGENYVVFLDGGWMQLSAVRQMNSHSVLLRPKAELLSSEDRDNLIRWSALFAPARYDNQLIDNLVSFRKRLHSSIDDLRKNENMTLSEASSEALDRVLQNSTPSESHEGFAPYGSEGRNSHLDPSGFYCSESGSDIFSYLGYRLYGEVPFEVVTAFSADGKLPSWAVYQNALGGFGAAGTPVEDIHHLYYNYFSLLDQAWSGALLPVPQAPGQERIDRNTAHRNYLNSRNFVEAMKNYKNSALSQFGLNNNLDPMADDLLTLRRNAQGNGVLVTQVDQLRAALEEARVAIQAQTGVARNMTQTVEYMFFKNQAYGPNHFFENGEHFDLVGVFYNSDLFGNFQAPWVVNSEAGNKQTTLYTIDQSEDPTEDGECVNTNRRASWATQGIIFGEENPSPSSVVESLID